MGIKSSEFTPELLKALKGWRDADKKSRSIEIKTSGDYWRIWIFDLEMMAGVTLDSKVIKGTMDFTAILNANKIEMAKFQLEQAQKILKEGLK